RGRGTPGQKTRGSGSNCNACSGRSSRWLGRSRSICKPGRIAKHSTRARGETDSNTKAQMSWNDFLAKMKRYDRNAEVIFDHEEPIGRQTDMVLPGKRWFGRSKKTRRAEDSRLISLNHR